MRRTTSGKKNTAPTFGDVFTIPDSQGDTFVLKLSQSVAPGHITATLNSYVVTDSIAANLKQALGFVRSALDTGQNQGTYLDGSFGSGKSHFMAVLYAILANYPEARAVDELRPLIAANEDIVDKSFLQLTYHFLDSSSIEDTVFKGYLKQLAERHPSTTPPVLHADEELFHDARKLRGVMGDTAFFGELNKASSATGGTDASSPMPDFFARNAELIGESAAKTWDAARFESAITSQDLGVRNELSTALTETLFTSHTTSGANWVGLSEGLRRISEHAKSLGYDAVVLYLDELILWLMFMTPNSDQFRRESQKLTLLVENDLGKLPIPIISFIARQKNLGSWAASTFEAGSDQLTRKQAFDHQEGRFNKISLSNENLPEIAHKRLLMPKDELAKQKLDQAFDELNLKPEVIQVLLNGENNDDITTASTMEQFRLTYPFSPALVDTLVNLSSVMQRERTALKTMENLLIDQRSTGTIGTVIPVGDAFDYLIAGAGSTDDSAALVFKTGREFWNTRFRPTILAQRGIDPSTSDADLAALPEGKNALSDIRLGKTLMLAAIAPNVASLKNLTASRLAALNHGSMVTLFESTTANQVLKSVRSWATEIPELVVDEGSTNPMINLVIEDVPWQEVINSARSHDSNAKRRERVRSNLRRYFGVADATQAADQAYLRTFVWRGTTRHIEVVFGNVRDPQDLTEDSFRPTQCDALRLVVDYPFDDEGHTIAEDHSRVEQLLDAATSDRFTVVWMPQFFTPQQMKKLGELVISDYVTTPAGLKDHTQRISREQVTAVEGRLKIYQRNLAEDLEQQIKEAYGISAGRTFAPGQEPIKSLDPTVNLVKPIGSTMEEAVNRLIEDSFSQRFPDHPSYDVNHALKPSEFNQVVGVLRSAATRPDGRVDVEPSARRIVRAILAPLGIAALYDSHLNFNIDTAGPAISLIDSTLREKGFDPNGPIQIKPLQVAIRELNPHRGLTGESVNLFVCVWAALKDREWYRAGVPISAPMIGEIDPSMELRPLELPDAATWEKAVHVYQLLVGDEAVVPLSVENLRSVQDKVSTWAVDNRAAIQGLSTTLAQTAIRLRRGVRSPRIKLVDAISEFLDELVSVRNDPMAMVNSLANQYLDEKRFLGAPNPVVLRAISSAESVQRSLNDLLTGVLGPAIDKIVARSTDDEEADRIVEAFATNLGMQEFDAPTVSSVDSFVSALTEWMVSGRSETASGEGTKSGDSGVGKTEEERDSENASSEAVPPVEALGRSFDLDTTTGADVEAAFVRMRESLLRAPGRYRIVIQRVED